MMRPAAASLRRSAACLPPRWPGGEEEGVVVPEASLCLGRLDPEWAADMLRWGGGWMEGVLIDWKEGGCQAREEGRSRGEEGDIGVKRVVRRGSNRPRSWLLSRCEAGWWVSVEEVC